MMDLWPAGVPSLAYLAARALRFRGDYRELLEELPEGAGDVLRRCPPPQVISHVRPGVSRRMCVAVRTKDGTGTRTLTLYCPFGTDFAPYCQSASAAALGPRRMYLSSGTLVIVPSNLVEQWVSEVHKVGRQHGHGGHVNHPP